MASQINISGLAAGLPAGQVTIGPITFTPANSMCEQLVTNLSSGDTTITVPPNATALLLVLPTTSNTVKVRTNLNSGDAGLPIATGSVTSDPFFFSFRGLSPTSIILNAGGSVTGVVLTFI